MRFLIYGKQLENWGFEKLVLIFFEGILGTSF